MKLIHFLWRIILKILNPSCILKATEIGKDITLQKNITIESGCYVYAREIGKYTYINKNCLIDKSVESIGNFCSIAYGCKIGLGNHPSNWISTHPFAYDKKYGFVEKTNFEIASTARKCIIGNDVWIGANAIILAGVTIGDGAIIGANAFVNKDIEPYSVVTGTPAKHLKFRFDSEIIDQLKKIKWWNWGDNKLKENVTLFNNPEQFINSNS
jgi:virginiamycin A acetyltransferase